MSNEYDMGGPAFPAPYEFYSQNDSGNIICTEGMTLWDYYAAAALNSLIASDDFEVGDLIVEVPEYAGWIADAMVAERAKRIASLRDEDKSGAER